MPTDKSYFDNVSEQISLTTGAQIDGFKKGDKERDAISQNENLSDSTADTAHNLNAVDTGIQTFSALTGTVDNIAQSVLLPAMAALGMKGIASFPITKQMDPVVGIDVHTVMIPPAPAPIPMPHPYIGMLFKAEDFIAAALASFIAPPPPAPEGPKAGEKATEAQQQATNDHKKAELVNTGLSMVVGMIDFGEEHSPKRMSNYCPLTHASCRQASTLELVLILSKSLGCLNSSVKCESDEATDRSRASTH